VLKVWTESGRINQIAVAFGCPADIDAITLTLLERTALGYDQQQSVRLSVDHLVSHDGVWRAMIRGVIPSSVRAQAIAVALRADATAPADAIVAVVFDAVQRALWRLS
jgi:hypothetical protein